MDKKYITEKLKAFADKYDISADEDTIGGIIDISSFRVLQKGKIISSIGDDTSTAGMVLSGMVRSYYIDEEGNDITRGFSPEGSLCADEGLLDFAERICMWETLEETTLMLCDVRRIKDLIHDNAGFKDIWIALLERSLRYKIYRENGFLVENAAERYVRFKKQYPEMIGRLPLKHIATYLGIAPESLSRIRSAMREETE
ncbi:MAG: Crp/Fnr family transcriptional regulator [Oscillospiraceae bacterium]|nr:Crp/Fnr family transcriptional regulator [Oscillospiraceae bacterium]